MVDHRASPGLGTLIGLFEAPTYTCSHCQRVVILNPSRTRERGYCPKCDHYVCDACNLDRVTTGVCKTFKEFVAEVQEAAIKTQSL